MNENKQGKGKKPAAKSQTSAKDAETLERQISQLTEALQR